MTRTRALLLGLAGVAFAFPALPQHVREYPLPTAASSPGGITPGPDGALWFGEFDANQIGRIAADGTVTEYPLPTPASQPGSVTLGPDGALWFTESNGHQIGRITKSGTITEFPMTASNRPASIVSGPDEALWFTDLGTNEIGRVTTAGTFSHFTIPTATSQPGRITVGPDGNLWFVERQANKIGRITPAGGIMEFPVPTAGSLPVSIAAGPDGNLWFVELFGSKVGRITTAGVVTEFPTPTPNSFPGGIAAGPDGNLWVTEQLGDNIARITTSGTFTEFPVPTAGSQAMAIAAFDGALWFCESIGNQIGRISINDAWPVALSVDAAASPGTLSFVNGVLEPGETVLVKPTWRNEILNVATFAGIGMTPTGPPGAFYGMPKNTSQYSNIASGTTADCGSNCYLFSVSNPATRPALHWDATFTEILDANMIPKTWTLHVGQTFTDVSLSSPFYKFIETLVHKNVTAGCGGTSYCPGNTTSRQQLAVFVLASKGGVSPPACGTPMFGDVPASSPFCKWIEELARRGVVTGCGGGNYCPGTDVTRAQMAVFALATLEGSGYAPPACGAPMFGDVPPSSPFCKWIEELARRGVVSGCGGGNYCPGAPVTRAQMSVFLTGTFGLSLYGP